MSTRSYVLAPISSDDADELRRLGGEVYVADSVPGFPCRQCLRDAEVGDELILVSHDPFMQDTPYRSASPIFLHRLPCEPSESPEAIPLQLTRRQLSVRSFDSDEMMIDAEVIDGDRLDQTIAKLFAKESADRLHIHNAGRGCWAATVTRPMGHHPRPSMP